MNTTFKQFKNQALKNPVIKAEYKALGPEYEILKLSASSYEARMVTD